MERLTCGAIGQDRKHFLAALGALDVGGRNDRHQHAGKGVEAIFAPDLFCVGRRAACAQLIGVETNEPLFFLRAHVSVSDAGPKQIGDITRAGARAECLPIDDVSAAIWCEENVVDAEVAVLHRECGWMCIEVRVDLRHERVAEVEHFGRKAFGVTGAELSVERGCHLSDHRAGGG